MHLYLVQHGEAKSKDVDPDRRLTEKGIQDVQKVAAFLKTLDIGVDSIWHSGKARALETANILATAFSSAQGVTVREGIAPKDSVDPVKSDLSKAEEDLMIVGHLPFLNKLASALITDYESSDAVAFRQAGVICLKRDDDDGNWRLSWMVIPDLLT